MDRIKNGERADGPFRRVVAPAGQYGVNRRIDRFAERNAPAQTGPDFGKVGLPRIGEVLAKLQVPRVF